MEELEDIQPEAMEVEEEESWEAPTIQPDGLAELKQQIADLTNKLTERPDDDEFTNEIAKKIWGQFAPALDEVRKPAAVAKIVNTVGKGLSDEAKDYVESYLTSQGYTSEMLEHLRTKEPESLKILRLAAEQVDSKSKKLSRPVPKPEAANVEPGDELDSESKRSIEIQAHVLYNEGLAESVEIARKVLTESYKEAANAK